MHPVLSVHASVHPNFAALSITYIYITQYAQIYNIHIDTGIYKNVFQFPEVLGPARAPAHVQFLFRPRSDLFNEFSGLVPLHYLSTVHRPRATLSRFSKI